LKKSVGLFCWNETKKCERPNETRADKPWTKIYQKAYEKHPMSVNILTSLRRFCIVTLKHHALHHGIAFKVSICIVDLPNKYCKTTFRPLPHLAYLTFNRLVVGKTTLACQMSHKSIIFQNCN